jgi:hypothetical protein
LIKERFKETESNELSENLLETRVFQAIVTMSYWQDLKHHNTTIKNYLKPWLNYGTKLK